MIKVKAAFYLRNLPTKVAIVLPDGQAKITNLVPFRMISENELHDLAVLNYPAYRGAFLRDEIPEYIYRFYGLEKVEDNQ